MCSLRGLRDQVSVTVYWTKIHPKVTLLPLKFQLFRFESLLASAATVLSTGRVTTLSEGYKHLDE